MAETLLTDTEADLSTLGALQRAINTVGVQAVEAWMSVFDNLTAEDGL